MRAPGTSISRGSQLPLAGARAQEGLGTVAWTWTPRQVAGSIRHGVSWGPALAVPSEACAVGTLMNTKLLRGLAPWHLCGHGLSLGSWEDEGKSRIHFQGMTQGRGRHSSRH